VRIESPTPDVAFGPAPVRALPRRARLDRFELILLTLFAAMSMWVVALDVWQAVVHDRVWTGTDGFFIVDQLQYVAWIQSASQHLLVANLFVLRPTPSDYFQPAVVISGAIVRLGVAPWLALLLWKPVAVVGMFFALRAYAYRTVPRRGERRAVIALGLFFGSFSLIYGSFGIVGDVMPGWLSWGYPFGLMAVALVVFGLLSYDRARSAGGAVWAPGVMGAVASALHPWQGELMILMVVFAELIRWREHRRGRGLALPALTLALSALPLMYYVILGHVDISWGLARDASAHAFPFLAIMIGVAPLAIVAALGYRGRPRDFLELMTRLWLPAAVLIYVVSATGLSSAPLHAFDGITAPLAVLAVTGIRRAGWRERIPRARLVGGVALALATIPANAYALAIAHSYTRPASGNANFITHDERDALTYLSRDPDPGGVLTQFYLGEVVPGRTGRHTLVGNCLWSEPRCMPRSLAADALFDGSMSRARARRFVQRSGARFVLASCNPHTNLERLLGSMIISVHRFGCAAVFDVGPAGKAEGPLAELPPDAVVRAPRRQ
jgi:hypothetical protein